MASGIGLSDSDLQKARSALGKWAKHIAHTPDDQEALIEKTLAAAADNPFDLTEHGPIDRALVLLMLTIAYPGALGHPRCSSP